MENSGLNHVLFSELDERVTEFKAAHDALDQRIKLWSAPGTFAAFDTNVYIHGDKLEKVDIGNLLGLVAPDGPIRLLVPMAVVDELDNLKQSKDKHVVNAHVIPGACAQVIPQVLGPDDVLLRGLLLVISDTPRPLVRPVAGAVHEHLMTRVDQPIQQ
jgi:hypothetical protein